MPRPRPEIPTAPLVLTREGEPAAIVPAPVQVLTDPPVILSSGPVAAGWTDPDGTRHDIVAESHEAFVEQMRASLLPELSGLPAAEVIHDGTITPGNYGGQPRTVDPTDPADADPDPADPDEPEDAPTLAALARIDRDPFGYIAGDAGTGKSYLARRYAERNPSTALLVATTGIAAVNLGGTTINALLRYYDTDSMETEYQFGRLGAALRQLAQGGVQRLIVDEISMMDGRQLEILGLALDDLNQELDAAGKPPLGVWLTGDFCQLPPVGLEVKKKKIHGGQEVRPAIYAFNSKAWDRWAGNTLTLTQIRRQADPDFIRAIQQLRKGDKSCVDYFRPMITPYEDADYQGTSIVATNAEVDRFNNLRMLKLDGPEERFTVTRGGQEPITGAPNEWKNIPETLVLKPGCLVMILANKRYLGSDEMMYANGDLAIFLRKVDATRAQVKLLRNDDTVLVESIYRERLKPGTPRRQRTKEFVDPAYILASIDYMPLRVAYASTVHKSQGLSLDRIQLLINSQFWMSSGMLYVGMSRARTPQGIKIVGTVDQFAARVRSNPAVAKWV